MGLISAAHRAAPQAVQPYDGCFPPRRQGRRGRSGAPPPVPAAQPSGSGMNSSSPGTGPEALTPTGCRGQSKLGVSSGVGYWLKIVPFGGLVFLIFLRFLQEFFNLLDRATFRFHVADF
jgi:hypothetical protein